MLPRLRWAVRRWATDRSARYRFYEGLLLILLLLLLAVGLFTVLR